MIEQSSEKPYFYGNYFHIKGEAPTAEELIETVNNLKLFLSMVDKSEKIIGCEIVIKTAADIEALVKSEDYINHPIKADEEPKPTIGWKIFIAKEI